MLVRKPSRSEGANSYVHSRGNSRREGTHGHLDMRKPSPPLGAH
jgi:hypothetical protein